MYVRSVTPIVTLVAFSFLWSVSGCDGKHPLEAIGANEAKPAPLAKDAATTAQPTKPTVIHTVLEGQTLWDIARAYNVTVQEIMEANQMRPGSLRRLRKGAQLRIPKATQPVTVETAADRAAKREPLPPLSDGAYHYLRQGETLLSLAQLYDVPLDTLMERNKLTDEDLTKLHIDQPVIIPGIKSSQVKNAEPGKQAGIVHEVVKGESIWDIAHTFQISVAALMAANGLSADNATTLREGSKLFLPGVEEDRGKLRVKRYTSARQRLAALFAHRLGLGSVKAASQLYHGRVEQKWIRAAGGYQRLDTTLRWPVTNGWFTRGYGSGEKGYHRAMDIMGKIGWNVRAAAAGIVGYSGGQVSGFGNMVILVHPGGWVTLYAHNSVNFVVAGEKVARGAVLAELGATGNALGPHVHFEFIYDGKNCDPSLILRPGVRHQNGKVSRLKYTKWASAKRPEAMRCAPRMRHPRGKAVVNETPVDEGGALPPPDAIVPTDIVQPPDTPTSPDTAPAEPLPVTPPNP